MRGNTSVLYRELIKGERKMGGRKILYILESLGKH